MSTLFFANDTVTVPVAVGLTPGSVTYSVSVPAGGVARLISATVQINPAGGANTGEVHIERVRYLPLTQSRDEFISEGTPNIREYAGDGQLPRLFPVRELLDDNSNLTMTLLNFDTATPKEVSMTHGFELIDILDDPKPQEPRLFFANVTELMAPGAEQDFVFSVPQGNVGRWREVTGFLFDNTANTDGNNNVIIKNISIVREGETQKTDILDGEMNFNEFAGNARFTRILELIMDLRSNSDIVVRVNNNDATQTVRVSLTQWIELVRVPANIKGRDRVRFPKREPAASEG